MRVNISGVIPKEHEREFNQALEDGDYSLILDLLYVKSVEVEDEVKK